MSTPAAHVRIENILRLYRQMPGAPRIPTEDGYEMTGDVAGNDHWNFCEAIVDLVAGATQARYR